MSPINALRDPSIKKLGVFDSGLGGLTVLHQLLEQHSEHDYVYFGDTAHVPYGSRDADNVVALVIEIARYLVSQGCQGLILACNTSSALALSALRATVRVPVIGVIDTASRAAVQVTDGTIAVLANPLTAASGVYKAKICNEAKLQGRVVPRVLEIGCPDLVPIVEEDRLETSESKQILLGYAGRILREEVDTLVLGCTHYPLLLPVLEPLLEGKVQIVNPADLIPEYLAKLEPPRSGVVEYRVSGSPSAFNASASKIIGRRVEAEAVLFSKELQRP